MTQREWNGRQWKVLQRYFRLYRLPVEPDAFAALAARYAAKHAAQRAALAA